MAGAEYRAGPGGRFSDGAPARGLVFFADPRTLTVGRRHQHERGGCPIGSRHRALPPHWLE